MSKLPGGEPVSILRLSLHGRLVGHLAGYRSGRNILLFASDFAREQNRPTLSLITHPSFPNSEELLSRDWMRYQRLHPLLSNLLPEGALRTLLAQNLKVHIPWRLIRSHLKDTLDRARTHWPQTLRELPMLEQHQQQLRRHWQLLHEDFQIDGS